MTQTRLLLTSLFTIWITTNSCSQSNSSKELADLFVGSTPCDNFIYSTLKIPANDTCEFIKWELSLQKGKNNEGEFRLTALYGESKPNTNGFKGGGKTIEIAGKYSVQKGINENAHLNVYRLDGAKHPTPLFLIEMDSNILHFADNDKKLLVGNGGWGYVLNRVK